MTTVSEWKLRQLLDSGEIQAWHEALWISQQKGKEDSMLITMLIFLTEDIQLLI